MRAWIVDAPGPVTTQPLRLVDRAVPESDPDEVVVRESACGLCRTDVHLAEGDLPPRRHGVVPGHEVVGTVEACGADSRRFAEYCTVPEAYAYDLSGLDGVFDDERRAGPGGPACLPVAAAPGPG